MLDRQIVILKSITKYELQACSKREESLNWQDKKIAQSCQQMESVENNCYIPDLVHAFPDENGLFTKWNENIFTCKRRCWTWRSDSSCSPSCNKSSNAAAFFFRIFVHHCMPCCRNLNLINLYCALRITNFLCLVELLRTDWRGFSKVCLWYAQGSMTHVKDMNNLNLVVPWHMQQALYLLKFGCLHQHRDRISIPSYHYTMATRRYCEGFA